ncbi:hypothetical protein ACMHYO_11695 [Allopusillimonas ginsengisoli]|uniref:hypothetical protein n=1 Tax=Allopusillimonas ginsengisoli TaxID=453575 RepID=UPI0039C48F97
MCELGFKRLSAQLVEQIIADRIGGGITPALKRDCIALALDIERNVIENIRGQLQGEDAEYSLLQGDELVASSMGQRSQAWQEICHYAAVYGQDGDCVIQEVFRVPVKDGASA